MAAKKIFLFALGRNLNRICTLLTSAPLPLLLILHRVVAQSRMTQVEKEDPFNFSHRTAYPVKTVLLYKYCKCNMNSTSIDPMKWIFGGVNRKLSKIPL